MEGAVSSKSVFVNFPDPMPVPASCQHSPDPPPLYPRDSSIYMWWQLQEYARHFNACHTLYSAYTLRTLDIEITRIKNQEFMSHMII